jgi:hypothetical protein
MAFDKSTRNRLARFVADARGLIAEEFTQQFQSLYGISPEGVCTPLEKLTHLDEIQLATASLLRGRIDYLVKTHPDDRDGTQAAVARLAREQAFTILNRFAAIRMAEKRGLIVESIGKGYQSKGFKVYETVTGNGLGETYQRYRLFLFCLFDEFAVDLGVLFDRHSPQALLFPREQALLALLELITHSEIEPLWAEDETIGWIYQYYNDPEERKKMRAESAAPRNSRELAVRNQFFTPRYVVEFLTDNTLGRIWYEMTKGQTRLAEQCRYLVRRPTEIFLAEGETAPETPDQEGLSHEELLKQPVHIPHRPIKDPREIRLLDPACGSMHFGLYAFDLFETIYEEAWGNGSYPALQDAYASKDEFLKDVPRLIIEHNIHGIDIDPRAVQIAGLSLWLRAQKAWQQQKVPAADRPRVRRSNIVCAEPMPGSPEMLEEFVATLKPELLGELVKTVFDKMQLAGEAGSLLKIEEEIRTAIDTARKEWLKQQEDLLTRKDGSQKEFFDTAEQQVIDALRAYAEQADANSYQRRLFADDAARGFAFIDLCRKRYDAVVMNPPFGEAASSTGKYVAAKYKSGKNDLYCAFVMRGSKILASAGLLGAITNRTGFFIKTSSGWRKEVFLEDHDLALFADLGDGVLDTALVETAAYIVSHRKNSQPAVFLRVVEADVDAKSSTLLSAIEGRDQTGVYISATEEFQLIPQAPFAYWVDSRAIELFSNNSTLSSLGIPCKQGVITADDFRFLRLRWEAPLGTGQFSLTSSAHSWAPLAKGGEFRQFVGSFDVLVLAAGAFREIITSANQKYPYLNGGAQNMLHLDPELFLKGGCFYTRRTSKDFSVRALPSGCVYSDKGPGITFSESQVRDIGEWSLIGILNSEAFRALLALGLGAVGAAARSYETGLVEAVPLPSLNEVSRNNVSSLSNKCYDGLVRPEMASEESIYFLTLFKPGWRKSDSIRELADLAGVDAASLHSDTTETLRELNELVWEAYGLDRDSRRMLCISIKAGEVEDGEDLEADADDATEISTLDAKTIAARLASYSVGTAFGRWDIRYATGERQPPELPDPFDSLPVCPPGMLQNAEGLPAEPKDVPADYPLRISWPGILVDDENHPEDIVARVREAIEVIWKDRAEAIEQEACGILGVKTLHDYFRRPAAFFADHLKRYSKSRRQAPIYWPLSTKTGSYTLWLYYHRLTDQTLHTCLADFLDPKIRKVQSELDGLTGSGSGGTRAGELREFLDELKDLRDEIERVIKLPWKPNLNDGVLITASPLWKLFRLPKWQKDLKACWDKLAKGEYDWAHLAHSIWPSRVEKACEKDRSIAIAHGLEHLCKVEPPKPNKKRGKKAAEEENEEPELIEED